MRPALIIATTASGSVADPGETEVGSPRMVPTLAPLAKHVTPATAPGLLASQSNKGRRHALGLGVTPVTADIAAQLRLPGSARGLIIEQVDLAGPTAGLLQPGDVKGKARGS